MAIEFNDGLLIDAEYIKKNGNAYAFKPHDRPKAPSINVDVNTVTVDEFDGEITSNYDAAVDSYKKSYRAFISSRDHLNDRLMNELAASTMYLTKNGVDLQNNEIVLHKKANEVFDMARSNRMVTDGKQVSEIADNYKYIYDKMCVKDDQSGCSLVLEYDGESADPKRKFDDDAFVLNSSESNPVQEIFPGDASAVNFILDNPNAVGNDRKYTAYTTVEPVPAAVETETDPEQEPAVVQEITPEQIRTNTAAYALSFEKRIEVKHNGEGTNAYDVVSDVWMIRSIVGKNPVAYVNGNLEDNADFGAWTKYEAPVKA